MKIDWRKIAPIFLLGLVLGAVGGSLAQRGLMRHWQRGPQTDRMLEKMSHELGLDGPQKDAVKALLESDRLKFEALRAASRAEIRKLLTAAQQAKFDEMTARLEARNKRR